MTTAAIAAPRSSTNGKARKTHFMSADAVAENWQCRKRDGAIVPFACDKMRKALFRCFNAISDQIELTNEEVETVVRDVVKGVVNMIEAQHLELPDVETVQRLVIQQLWAQGHFHAAEHYQSYREERRKLRSVRPVSTETLKRVREDQQHFSSSLQYYQFMSKFSRWNEEERRRETWKETVYGRVMPWFRRLNVKLSEQEWQELSSAFYNLEASPAMRVVQMAGPALDRCHVGVYNCAYAPVKDIFSYPELLYILMQGTGQGFSVESQYVADLPRIRQRRSCAAKKLIVEDTTEGWCDSFKEALEVLWDGGDVDLDTSGVRRKGARLKTKGGRASGPQPLIDLISLARKLIQARAGRFLEDIDLHDLSCMTGNIVSVGGVRRAALISLSDLTSEAMRHAKSGAWWQEHTYRTKANNSAVFSYPEGTVPSSVFMDEWIALMKSGSGERGIFNRTAANKCRPSRRQACDEFGVNPCAEIVLRPYQFCNLTMAIGRAGDTVESLRRKVRIATIFGTLQATCTNFGYIRPEWKKNCEEERLLGVDITGQADCPLLRYNNSSRDELLESLRKYSREVNQEYSKRFGIAESAAINTVKPGGDSAVLYGCSSGISPRFAKRQIRWCREGKDTPIARFLIDSGVPYADAPENPGELYVFGFPLSSPDGADVRNSLTALQQFDNWRRFKKHWAEHSVSTTIYVEENEWPALGAKVYEHLDEVTGVAFLPKDNGTYTYAPNEELSEEEYAKFVANFPEINWAKLSTYEDDDYTGARTTMACVGGSCD